MDDMPPAARQGVDASDAWRSSLADPHAVWHAAEGSADVRAASVRERIGRGLAVPNLDPSFRICADDVFFCIGSCFAREIEEHLNVCGLNVASLGLRVPLDESRKRPTATVNKYTTASMHNELRWAFGEAEFPEAALVADGGGYRDLQLQPFSAAVTYGRARERRADAIDYFARLRRSTVVVMTLGVVEVWSDHETSLDLNAVPTPSMAHAYPGRFTVHRSDYRENRAHLEGVWTLLKRHAAPGVRLIVTTSPVPMQRTFLGEDVLVANGYSKATLRAVAGDVASAHDGVEYFGSYEMATVSERRRVFRRADEQHVKYSAVGAITDAFLRTFGLQVRNPYPDFHETPYLVANPDVRAALGRGEFASGFDHWLRHGRAERRPLAPPDVPVA